MSVFDYYARYYDLLYKDKDYRTEADYVDKLIRQYAPAARMLLDLGCGTGKHDFEFANLGYRVTGVDLASNMVEQANQSLQNFSFEQPPRFQQGDIRTVRLPEKYDAVVSLFHVLSYQVTNQDLSNVFETARHHLNPGGVFIFDAWYGPGVLTDPPVVRVKRLSDELIDVTRIAEPVMHPDENVVDVNYTLFIHNKTDDIRTELSETHRMRYLFTPEVRLLASANSFSLVHAFEFATNRALSLNSWNVCYILRNEQY